MGISGVIDFDDEEIEAASHWYGGQGSMLYAVTSTGALKRGTIRPRHDDGTPMTDEEWIVDLAERLEGEAEDAAREAGKRARKAKGDEKKELLADKDGLRSIALKASQLVRDAKRANKPAHATKRSSKQVKKDRDQFLAELAARPKRSANVIVYSRPSGYWYAQAHDAATGARISDATDYSREGVLRALRGQYPMMGVTIESVRDHDPYETAHATKGSARMHHAIKKTATQLDREIDQAIGKRIDRKKLGEMMHPWSSLGYGSAGTAVYAVASHYDSGMKYPDRTVVERALKAIEADIPKAEHGAHGWTKADAKDLRRIAAGLRYYLLHDYGSGGNGGRAHSTRRDDDPPS